jgi:hypothetical protein
MWGYFLRLLMSRKTYKEVPVTSDIRIPILEKPTPEESPLDTLTAISLGPAVYALVEIRKTL